VALIRDSHVERLVLVMDGDEAGRDGAAKVRAKLAGIEIDIRAATLPEGEDAASYLAAHSAEDFGKLLAAACDTPAAAQDNTLLAAATMTRTANGFRLTVEDRSYEVFAAEGKPGKVRATVKAVTRDRLRFHIDTVDLYQARSRKTFAADAARLYGADADAIGLDLNRLIEAAEKHLAAGDAGPAARPGATVSPEAEKEARAFGRRPDLLDAVARDVERCGYVGERSNVLAAYLTMTSRKMLDPLALLILSGSGAGKSALQNTVLSLCPEEDLVKLTSLTERALFYKDEQSLKHKVLALEEVAGGEDASYAIRSLISQGELVIESTVKDPATGRMTTMQNKVYGPTAVFETTTNPNVDPETKSRFMLASIDESREQTRKILDAQRKARTVEGLRLRLQRDAVREKHRAFQRMLRPLDVRNPYGELLTYTDDRLLMRRDNPKYLALIDAVAFLHQAQKPVKRLSVAGRTVEFIEVTLRDIALANELAAELLGRSLDELSGPSRRLLLLIEEMVTAWARQQKTEPGAVEFSRRQLREHTRWSDYQVRTHLDQLVALEYVAAVCGRNGAQYQYRLMWDGQGREGGPFLLGLKPIEELRREAELLGIATDGGAIPANLAASEADLAGQKTDLAVR
jgi:PAS domain-containing protein